MLKASFKEKVYKRFFVNILENIFFLNLGLLAATVYYLEGHKTPKVCDCLTASISVAFMTFFAITACHIYYKVGGCSALQKFMSKINGIRKVKGSVQKIPPETTPTNTITYIELREALLESDDH